MNFTLSHTHQFKDDSGYDHWHKAQVELEQGDLELLCAEYDIYLEALPLRHRFLVLQSYADILLAQQAAKDGVIDEGQARDRILKNTETIKRFKARPQDDPDAAPGGRREPHDSTDEHTASRD